MWGAGHELNIKQEILESPEKVGQLSVGEPSYQHFFKDSPSPPPTSSNWFEYEIYEPRYGHGRIFEVSLLLKILQNCQLREIS